MQESELIWQDREVRFDLKASALACRKGEKAIDSINSVEDTKGNNGDRGSLIVTTLRLLWISHANSRVNLSLGFNTVVSVNVRKAKSKLRGQTQALCILCKYLATKYEFVFTSLVKNAPKLFTTVQAVLRCVEPLLAASPCSWDLVSDEDSRSEISMGNISRLYSLLIQILGLETFWMMRYDPRLITCFEDPISSSKMSQDLIFVYRIDEDILILLSKFQTLNQ